ncbi:MAG: hypothetical protein NVSMB4_19780 [Acidimicrobiales bacterium]
MLRTSDRANRRALRGLRDALGRLFEEDGATDAAVKADLVLGGMTRRRLLHVGGMTVLSAAVLGACSGGGHPQSRGSVPTSSTLPPDNAGDIRILRTASSLEHYAVGVYMEAAGLNLLQSPMGLEVAKYFADQHSQHAGAFEGATGRIGGQPFTQANPVLSRMATQRLGSLKSEADVLRLAYEIETVAAATYVAAAEVVVERAIDATMSSIAAVEARHVSVLGMMLDTLAPGFAKEAPPYRQEAFASTDGALPAGTGV